MKGLILAAGIGTRLKPLTYSVPKALIPIDNRPLISYILWNFKKTGIKNIGIIIRPDDKSKFQEVLKKFKIKISYIYQEKPKGTADALRKAERFIERQRFLLTYCDAITDYDYKKIIRAHLGNRPLATVLINKEKDSSAAGQIVFRDGKIIKIVEKPRKKISDWVCAGLMVLEPDIFRAFAKVRPPKRSEFYIAEILQYLINQGHNIHYIKIDTWRININSFGDIKRLARIILKSEGHWEGLSCL